MRESDRERFKVLAEKRVNRALKDLSLIGNLGNKSNYSYTEDDVKKILKALRDGVEEVRQKFELQGSKAKEGFTL